MERLFKVLSILSLLVGVGFFIGPFWYWAVFGMAEPIGKACAMTSLTGFCGAFGFAMASDPY